jgi:hypothetical protein
MLGNSRGVSVSIKGDVLYHPVNGSTEQTWDGFSWPALLFGVIWLLVKGLYGHFLINVVLLVVTAGFAAPIIWIVYGAIGNGAHKNALLKKGYLTSEQWSERSGQGKSVPAGVGVAPKDAATQLREFADLRDRGVLTDEEFAQQKAKLLRT